MARDFGYDNENLTIAADLRTTDLWLLRINLLFLEGVDGSGEFRVELIVVIPAGPPNAGWARSITSFRRAASAWPSQNIRLVRRSCRFDGHSAGFLGSMFPSKLP